MPAHVPSLAERHPRVPADRIVGELVPPPRFAGVRFDTYLPDPAEPSQQAAVEAVAAFAASLATGAGGPQGRGRLRRVFGRRELPASGPSGLYLDGGFGVGKTHLLASLWHAAPGPKAFGTFVEFTNLVGALGYRQTVEALLGHRLICLDEFELDDPGDTVLISTLLGELADLGVRLAATSNTLPGALGEGRFAADDFLREIQGLAARFEVARIEGDDYRHRGLPAAPPPLAEPEVRAAVAATPGATLDEFDGLLAHLSELHPVRYAALLDGVQAVGLLDVHPVPDQNAALRLVVLADRLYDRDVPVLASGVPLDAVFSAEMLRGGYRKKYHRAISRLVALAREGEGLQLRGTG